jgi:hypothetical protein
MIDEARDEARKLDAHFKRTGKIVGPMHGVPISVKEVRIPAPAEIQLFPNYENLGIQFALRLTVDHARWSI